MDDRDSNLTRAVPAATKDASFNSRRAFARHWRESVRYFGLLKYLREVASAIWRALLELLPSHRKASFGDLDYDWSIPSIPRAPTLALARSFWLRYGASLFRHRALVVRADHAGDPGRFSQFTFVDLGSGKGRVLLMASGYPFQRIIGVEFMSDLHCAAIKNVASYSNDHQRCRHIEAVCLDARDFQFPSDPLLVYLFNPFSESTFAQILQSLRQSVEQAPRPAYIAYRFTEFEHLLARAEWLEKIAGAEQWAVYKNRRGRD